MFENGKAKFAWVPLIPGAFYAFITVTYIMLRELTPPWIKIDHTFVASIKDSSLDQAIMEYILQLCGQAGIQVCVEGIETFDIRRTVCRYHPELLQGYYFSKPMPYSRFSFFKSSRIWA